MNAGSFFHGYRVSSPVRFVRDVGTIDVKQRSSTARACEDFFGRRKGKKESEKKRFGTPMCTNSLLLRQLSRCFPTGTGSQLGVGTKRWLSAGLERTQVAHGLGLEKERGESEANESLRSRKCSPSDRMEVLMDKFGRKHNYLRISLTERCNLRCLYCMPEEGVELTPNKFLLSATEIERLARLFVSEGVEKIRLTGGEPTVRKDFLEIVEALGAIPGLKHLGLTTNGLTLARRLRQLKCFGLDLLNISLDSLCPATYRRLTRRDGLEKVLRSIDTACDLGYDPVKVNCVVMRGHNDSEILDFVDFARNRPVNVRFIEYMPFDGNAWTNNKMVSYQEMVGIIEGRYGTGCLRRMNDGKSEVAKNFRIDGHLGSISFVTSMTEHFCAGCSRLRIMADGNLKVCLFGPSEVSLRDAMRSGSTDEELLGIISGAVDRKKEKHAGMFEIAKTPNRSMIRIGG